MSEQTTSASNSVIITGCSSGIGLATAKAFVDAGWAVYPTARSIEDIEDLSNEHCTPLALDVTDDGAISAVIDRVLDEAGTVDCLVNNAGYAQMGPVEDVAVSDLQRQFDVNVFGPQRLNRAVLPSMRSQGSGTIVNVSSVWGQVSFPGVGPYAASKHALEAMTDALRAEVNRSGIDVVLIQPGPVDTNFVDRLANELPDERSPPYTTVYSLLEDIRVIGSDNPLADDPSMVAEAILDVAHSDEPPSRYPVGTPARFASFARYVPDRAFDTVYDMMCRFLEGEEDG